MLQQQLQLQNPLPVDDMNMADAPVKSGFGGNDKSTSEGFEQALSQSQDHQKQSRQSDADEHKAAKSNQAKAENDKVSSDKVAKNESVDTPKEAPERVSKQSNDNDKADSKAQLKAEDSAAKSSSTEAVEQAQVEVEGQESAANFELQQQIKNIQDLVTELDTDMEPSELKALLSELGEALEKLAPQLEQLKGKTDPISAKLEMALNQLTDFLNKQVTPENDVKVLSEQFLQKVKKVTAELKLDLNQKSAALDKLVADLETENEQAQWLATIAALVKIEKPKADGDVEIANESELDVDGNSANLNNYQHQLNLETQTLNQAKYEVNVNAEQLSLKDKVVFEPLAQTLVKQAEVPTSTAMTDGQKTQLTTAALNKLNLEQTPEEQGPVETGQKSEKVTDKQAPISAQVALPKVAAAPTGNTTAQALAQLTANLQGTDVALQAQDKLDPQQAQMSDFSREKFLSELSSSPVLMRSLQANPVSLEIDTPMVKTQVEVQGVQLDKTLAQPKLESLQNAKQEGVIRENILFNKNELAANMQTQVGLMMARNMKSVDIRLDPPELGSIQVRLSVTNEQAAVSFVVSSQQAKDALEGSMNRLKELLEQEGLNLADTDVKQENGGKEQGEEGDEHGQLAGGQMDDETIEVSDPVLAEKIRQINSPWNVDFYA